jgi:hypothetical protein
MKTCHIRRATRAIACNGEWDDPIWADAEELSLDIFVVRSSSHRPKTLAKLSYDESGLHVLFDVRDRYVLCAQNRHQLATNRDSCVEFFFQPTARGYFNFEVSCGGWVQVFYIEDNTPHPKNGFTKYTMLSDDDLSSLCIFHTAPARIEKEIVEPMDWRIQLGIPFALIEKYTGKSISAIQLPGTTWRGNLYKCADDSSHPHWASWSELGSNVSFHVPEKFGALRFL